jgi:hypothetical protein
MHAYEKVLRTYMKALDEGDYVTIKGLFSDAGEVQSPFIGLNKAASFFDQLSGATTNNVITPIDVFLSQDDKEHAVAYFQYDWTVTDGTLKHFGFNLIDIQRL